MRTAGEKIRQQIFWLTDIIKGSHVKKHFASVKQVMESAEAKKALATDHVVLKKILQHAVDTVPYYKSFIGKRSLQDFPVASKTLIRENFDAFTSSAFTKEQQLPVVTSGSTGTPFKVLHNKDKRNRNTADTMYFAHRAGFTVGDKLLYLKIWSALNRKSDLRSWMQNVVPVDVIAFNDRAIEEMIRMMENSNSTFGLLGYSSAIELVCRYLDKSGKEKVEANLASALSMSESLNDYTKYTIEKYFGIPVCSRYSNLENGILAQQLPQSGHRYLVNTASYVTEILDMASDTPAAKGQPGRIVITDLYNYAMPMIRYDTGDVGIFSDSTDEAGSTYLERVEGRKLDLIYATDGSLVSSYIVYKNMWQYTEITQYQLIQHGVKDYTIKINMDGAFAREEKLLNEFKQYLGNDANIVAEYVEEIPLLDSGKRKKIVNTYYNQP